MYTVIMLPKSQLAEESSGYTLRHNMLFLHSYNVVKLWQLLINDKKLTTSVLELVPQKEVLSAKETESLC